MTTSKYLLLALLAFIITSCDKKQESETPLEIWTPYDETKEIAEQQRHENDRMKFKLIQSKVVDKNEVFNTLYNAVSQFSEERYNEIKPLILEQDIPSLQKSIAEKKFNYEELTLFYLKRIYTYELDSAKTLNAIISLNPKILEQAKKCDKNRSQNQHAIYGMPILLKDNINTKNMPTTAGAVVLQDNQTQTDAELVKNLKRNGALVLGKVNLSEWAYYFCSGCPLGYSAIGGQTLNPYGRKVFETGGSSAGSGVAAAANYAVATVGTETSGSIISPSSQNSVVGLKPTVGVVSGEGIVPISSTLDTAGPMAKNVIDSAILLDAMTNTNYSEGLKEVVDFNNMRLGVYKRLLADSIYNASIKFMKKKGATIIELDEPKLPLDGFLTLLNLDMKADLPKYLDAYSKEVPAKNLQDIVAFNAKDSVVNMPYNQELFDSILKDSTSTEDFKKIKTTLLENGNKFFQQDFTTYNLDAVLSINNYHSSYAAVGFHPALALPMGYKNTGEPIALTFIGSPNSEKELLKMGYAFEKAKPIRKIPNNYSY